MLIQDNPDIQGLHAANSTYGEPDVITHSMLHAGYVKQKSTTRKKNNISQFYGETRNELSLWLLWTRN